MPTKFDIIIADPPWDYNDKGRGSTEKHYPTLKKKQLLEMGELVQQVCHDQSVLLLWGTWPHLVTTIVPLFPEWGFEYKTCAFMYYKVLQDNSEEFRKGMGAYSASNSEPCFLARKKGKMLPTTSRKVRQVMFEKTGQPEDFRVANLRHSAKPPAFYDRVDELYEGYSKLELFARQSRKDWTTLGNEIDGLDIREALSALIQDSAA